MPTHKFTKTILIYGISPMQLLELNSLAQPLGIRCKAVAPSQAAYQVDELLSEEELPGLAPMQLLGRFAVMAGFDGQEQLAMMLINKVSPGVIKAIRTAHNGSWRFCDLCMELTREHHTMNNRK